MCVPVQGILKWQSVIYKQSLLSEGGEEVNSGSKIRVQQSAQEAKFTWYETLILEQFLQSVFSCLKSISSNVGNGILLLE